MLFPKMDIEAWKGLVPVLNFMELSEKVGRSRWYGLLFLVPIVAFFVVAGLTVATARSFGRDGFGDAAISVIYSPITFFKLAKDDSAQYQGPILKEERSYQQQILDAKKSGHKKKYERLVQKNPYAKSVGREWIESIVFAVFAAAFIRMFLVEAYVIPTPSMEGSLLVGDFLFVSKTSYGIRTPQTIAMVPLLHNRVPKLGTESYFKKPSLPYYRLPALREIKRNDPIVFNWPVGDSVYITSRRSYTVGQVERNKALYLSSDRELQKKVTSEDYVVRPNDKKDHYIKRCIGAPGDSLQIINRQVYINGSPGVVPEYVQYSYITNLNGLSINRRDFEKISLSPAHDYQIGANGAASLVLNQKEINELKQIDPKISIAPRALDTRPTELFPHDPKITGGWTVDNYGPIYIPEKGATVELTKANLPYYKRIIRTYENNDLTVSGDDIMINGEKASSYTFKQDYYWAMGDNRHNSEDSRMWGFVPHDHMVGKPLFIWFSTKDGSLFNGIRWDRIFKSASKS
jgi:signal peptidase I